MKYELFISDYDGTLGSSPKNDIDSETLDAINKFIEKGGIFTVCSGRETSSINRICKEQGLKGLLVSLQGAKITDIETGNCLFSGGLSIETSLQLLDAVKEYNLTPVIYTDEGLYYNQFNQYVKLYQDAVRVEGKVVDLYEKIASMKGVIHKICWLGPDEVVNKCADDLNKVYSSKGVKFNSGARNLLEAINSNCGKGKAVRFIADYYNIPLDKVITVGDSTNDLELVCGEWHGVAVGDGREQLKRVAKEITVPFKDKPVKVLLEKYCLS